MTAGFAKILTQFVIQASSGDLKVSYYPKTLGDFRMRASFGIGGAAKIPWIAFITPEMEVSKGFYPVYLYYKAQGTLVLAYGVSETDTYGGSWPLEVQNESNSIRAFFGKEVPRYGDSFVFKAYKVSTGKKKDIVRFEYVDTRRVVEASELEADLQTLLEYYDKVASQKTRDETSPISQGRFYMEKQLEDFLIHNWEHTELGSKLDLITEDGVPMSQQYQTDVGPIDILAKDKKTGSYVVIELKRNQTSDDTIGQAARYMGWIKQKKGDKNVRAIIIAGNYDKRLDYALKMFKNIEVYLYDVVFKLRDFSI